MHFIYLFVMGMLIGFIAKKINKGPEPGGILATMLIGVLGTYLGFFIRTMLGGEHDSDFSLFSFWDWVYSLGGAMILLYVWKRFIAPKVGEKKQID